MSDSCAPLWKYQKATHRPHYFPPGLSHFAIQILHIVALKLFTQLLKKDACSQEHVAMFSQKWNVLLRQFAERRKSM